MSKLLFALSGLLISAQVHAFAWPLPTDGLLMSNIRLPHGFTAKHNFEGIVALNNCSGSVVQLEGATDNDSVLVLTNGHCLELGFPEPNEIVANKNSSRAFSVLDKNANVIGKLYAKEIIYSTMTKTDMTIYKLDITVGEFKKKFGFDPLTLSSKHPDLNQNIEVISGYWQRGYTCSIEAFIYELHEGDWTNKDSIRYSRPGCEVIGGTSGSPIVAAGTRTVIGVNNTGNESGLRCTENNPCEIDKDGKVFYKRGYSYGQQTYWLYSCLNAKKELDLKQPGCELFH